MPSTRAICQSHRVWGVADFCGDRGCVLVGQVTIGASFLSQTVALTDGTTVKFEIWDTAGQVRHRSLCALLLLGLGCGVLASHREVVGKAPVITTMDTMPSRILLKSLNPNAIRGMLLRHHCTPQTPLAA